MRRPTIFLCITLLATVLIAVAGVFAFRHLGTWLIVSDPLPDRVDVIFCFGGESVRVRYSLELAERYPDAHVIISAFNKSRYQNDFRIARLGPSRFSFVDTCSNTFAELSFLRQWLSSAHATSSPVVALVSGPYHMRRISILTSRIMKDTPFRFRYLPVALSVYGKTEKDYEYWWRTPDMTTLVEMEGEKILAAWLHKF
jgi:uncharacterized SAM-binding protein YcdF (DUF218 family)